MDGKDIEIDLDELDSLNLEKVAGDEPAPPQPKYIKNPADVRAMVGRLLDKYHDHFNFLNLNQFAIVKRNMPKASKYGAVKKIRLVKEVEHLFFKANDECRDPQFLLEIDNINFNALDEEDQEKALFRQLCQIFYDNNKEKFILIGPDASIYLAMVRVWGDRLSEVHDVKNALSVNEAESDDEDED